MTTADTKTKTDTAPQSGDMQLFAMTHMLRYSAKAKDASFPVTELFFDQGAGALRYVALDVGGWFDRREIIVAAHLMDEPDNASRAWPVEISPEGIKNAPEWTDPKVMESMSPSAMPHIMVSPYGGHFAGTRLSDDRLKQEAPDSEGNLKVDGFARLNDWIGLPIVGQDGDVGTLIDFLFEADTGQVRHLVIDTGGMLAAQQVVVPYDLLTGLGNDGAHANVNVTQKLLREAPPLEHFDEINR